jgi:hypothetical protein
VDEQLALSCLARAGLAYLAPRFKDTLNAVQVQFFLMTNLMMKTLIANV